MNVMNLENVVKMDCVTILTGVTIAHVKQVRVFSQCFYLPLELQFVLVL